MDVKSSAAKIPPPSVILGFDPGRDKCGLAVWAGGRVLTHAVVPAGETIATIAQWIQEFGVTQLVMGNQTTAKQWRSRLEQELVPCPPLALVDERNSTLEARDRYWQLYPPRGLTRLLPRGLRQPPRPIDDIVAILLIERYRA
ncbi:MAG: pre-16S rRNA-processing nuclease YqgF [Prochlorothrix sp.]|nr:pre-16S rRNA-processing nuclease YqgF [Prochlorothrix sp.]